MSTDASPRSARLAPGTRLGERYRIVANVGGGGMGDVYKARDLELDRDVALKLVHPLLATDATALARFRREVQLATRITHPNVLRIFDVAEASGFKFITMQLVEGEDLAARIEREGRLAWREMVNLVRQTARGLEAAHAAGVVHRDLKPRNVLIDRNGSVYVADFGLATALGQAGVTASGALLGTPEYMAPEQVRGECVDARADVYALGLLAYQMVTGELPSSGETPLEVLAARAEADAPRLQQTAPDVPSEVACVIERCLEREPARRYASAGAVADALDAFAGAQVAVSQSASRRALARRVPLPSRLRRASPVLALAVCAAIAVAIGLARHRSRGAGVPPSGSNAPPAAAIPIGRAAGQPLTVLVADFANRTGDPSFDGAIEPMFNIAIEEANFIGGFNRGEARKLAAKLPHPTEKLDEASARLVAVSQAVRAVVVGSVDARGSAYTLSVKALDPVSGSSIANAEVSVSSKNDVLLAVPRLASEIRRGLGDKTLDPAQLVATSGPFTAASLEVVHEYGVAMEQQRLGKFDEAFRSFARTAALDPNFARAYTGMAATAGNLGRWAEAEDALKLAMAHIDRMTERERYNARGYYYLKRGNYPKCIEELSTLVQQYPADVIGINNLSTCYAWMGDFPRAIEASRRALAITPNDALMRTNLGVLECYAGDFDAGEREATAVLAINPSYESAGLTFAYSQIGRGDVREGHKRYDRLAGMSDYGAVLAALGHADLAIYEGHYSDAVRVLEGETAKKTVVLGEELAALAYAQLSRGQRQSAIRAALGATERTNPTNIRLLGARLLAEAGDHVRARAIAHELASKEAADAQVATQLIEGIVALNEKHTDEAIRLFGDAQKVIDTWIGRFDLGRALLAGGRFSEADAELERCIQRRGEALELDNNPTFGYFPSVHYYQGRAREALNDPRSAESYRAYLAIRGEAGEDPLLPEIRRRLGER